jgi:hypothetical protein
MMFTNHERNGEDELQAARRTAYALGQTSGAEEAAIKAELAASPQAQQEVEAVAALAAQLKEAAGAVPRPEASPELRQAVKRRLAKLAPAAGRAVTAGSAGKRWPRRLAALALTVALLALALPIAWPVRQKTGKVREMARQSTADSQARPATGAIPEIMIAPSRRHAMAYDPGPGESGPGPGMFLGYSNVPAAKLQPMFTTPSDESDVAVQGVDSGRQASTTAGDAYYLDTSNVYLGGTRISGGQQWVGAGRNPSDGQLSDVHYELSRSDYSENGGQFGGKDTTTTDLTPGEVAAEAREAFQPESGGINLTWQQAAQLSQLKVANGYYDMTTLKQDNNIAPGAGGSGAGFGSRGSSTRQQMLASGGGTKHTERAVTGYLAWMARHQDPDGHWSLQNYTQQCKPGDTSCSGAGEIQADAAATGLGLLPFLAAGQTHKTRGPYRDNVGKGIDWLIRQQQPDGNLAKGSAPMMYSHGLATIALSEAYGLSGDRQVGEAAQRAVNFIAKVQTADGGWREGNDPGDTTLVGWEVMALKSARMSGLDVADSAFAAAGKWLESVALNHGAEFSLAPGLGSSPEATAAGLLCRQYLGANRSDPGLTGGMNYMLQHLPDDTSPNIRYWYAGTQFMHNMNGYEWDTWNRKMRDLLIRSQVRNPDQCANGSFAPQPDPWGKRGGRIVQTALAALTLETYYRYLPLFKSDAAAGKADTAGKTDKTLSGAEQAKAAAKPLETWKPAHVVPNSSRLMVGEREELPIKGMQVDVRVDGFRARVLIDLYYYNDRPQQLEGNFQLRLPDEASPYFFAFGRTVYQAPQVKANDSMFFQPQQVSQGDTTPEKILALRDNSWEQPKVARMVPREKAALAYREMVHRRVDPALVEWSGAGVFQCRVFPLAPQSLHRVTVGYDVDLTRAGDDLELRLDLPGQTPATIVDLNIAASDARQVSLDAPATNSADGQRLSYRLVDPKDRPLSVRLRKPGLQMLTGSDEATGDFFATRVGLTLPQTPSVDRAKQAVFIVDTSLSAGPQFPLWTMLLRATLENNRDSIKEFSVLFFNVETFWWQEKFVDNTPENVEALMAFADGLALEGATDLGRALREAAAPKWQKRADSSPPPDLFLLSDGAATWGEDRWPLLAAELGGGSPALFAYRTGLAGGDPRLLAYLAERTGGALFSLVGEAEVATASVAHRNRPWRLTGIEMAGAHDVLVAGRPQNVFPGQQLLIVGRLEPNTKALTPGPSPNLLSTARGRGESAALVFTLQQGKTTQTITVKPEQVLTSELAARTFGQVATSQLEDVSGVVATAEPVATAYARHFRVTGRTCSLLMLETEQDYARYNIRPEEDSFVVKERTAGPLVAKAVADATATMSDPKANFLAWFHRVQQSPAVHFDLPPALNVALDGLPAQTFAVAPAPLVCKLRLRKDQPANLQMPWQSGRLDYQTLDAEAQRRLAAYGADDALKALSSLVEERPGDAALERDLAFSAIEWQRPGEAYHLLRRAARTFEPITFHAMAHCLEQMGQADLAIVYYELACGGQWDARFGDMHNIAQLDYLRFLRRVTAGQVKTLLADYARARLATLAGKNYRDAADVAALIFWNTDGTDVDLHVIEPSGEECYYQHTQTASGGHISRDVTTGYGPELYLLPAAPAGIYHVSAHYYAADANRASTRTKVLALIYEGWGTKDEKLTIKALALTGQKENHELATVKR